MPFVTNQGVRIHYERIGNGPVLVMHHGLFGSGADWLGSGAKRNIFAKELDSQFTELLTGLPVEQITVPCFAKLARAAAEAPSIGLQLPIHCTGVT